MKKISTRGVTLVEVVIAMVIVMIVGLGVVQVLQINSRASVSALKRIQASIYLDQIHNHLQRSNVAELKMHYAEFPQIIHEPDTTAEVFLSSAAPDGSRHATITVNWTADRKFNSLSEDVTLIPR